MRNAGNQRHDNNDLSDHHRRRREQKAQYPKRPGARQQNIDNQPDNNRWQAHQRIQYGDDTPTRPKPPHRQQRRQRQSNSGRNHQGAERDLKGAQSDLNKLSIKRHYKPKRAGQSVPQVNHVCHSPFCARSIATLRNREQHQKPGLPTKLLFFRQKFSRAGHFVHTGRNGRKTSGFYVLGL